MSVLDMMVETLNTRNRASGVSATFELRRARDPKDKIMRYGLAVRSTSHCFEQVFPMGRPLKLNDMRWFLATLCDMHSMRAFSA